MEWEVEFTDDLSLVRWPDRGRTGGRERQSDSTPENRSGLPRPHADLIHSSRQGRLYRVLFAFDPRRCAVLLIGGDKTGNDRWYEEFVPIADALYGRHLEALKKEEK
jgi:hypothetical protein